MPGAYQMAHVAELFESIEWWRLVPAPEMVLDQPGREAVGRTVVAARSEQGDLAVVYVPSEYQVHVALEGMEPRLSAFWFDPRIGSRSSAAGQAGVFVTPDAKEDYLLVLARS